MGTKIDVEWLQFVLTSGGRLGVGYCYGKEEGGFRVIKWCPDGMVRQANWEAAVDLDLRSLDDSNVDWGLPSLRTTASEGDQ